MTTIISLAFEQNEEVAEDLKLTKIHVFQQFCGVFLGANTSELHFGVSLGDFDGNM